MLGYLTGGAGAHDRKERGKYYPLTNGLAAAAPGRPEGSLAGRGGSSRGPPISRDRPDLALACARLLGRGRGGPGGLGGLGRRGGSCPPASQVALAGRARGLEAKGGVCGGALCWGVGAEGSATGGGARGRGMQGWCERVKGDAGRGRGSPGMHACTHASTHLSRGSRGGFRHLHPQKQEGARRCGEVRCEPGRGGSSGPGLLDGDRQPFRQGPDAWVR